MDKLRAIQYFCRIAETRSFAVAAQDLDVVPSVLSRSISTLEANIKFRLFNRTTRKVSLTENGALYYERCKRLLFELDEAEALPRARMEVLAGRLAAGIHPAISRVVMAHIGEFLRQHPEIVIYTSVTSSPATMLDDKVDLLISIGGKPPSSYVVKKLAETRFSAFASPSYLQKAGIPDGPGSLVKHRIIISGRRDSPPYSRWQMTNGSQTEITYVAANVIAREGVHIQEACLSGAGIARLFDVSVRDHLRSGALVRVLPEWSFGTFPVMAIYPEQAVITARARALSAFIARHLRQVRSGSD